MRHITRVSNLSFFNESTLAIEAIVANVENKISAKTDKQGYENFCRNKFRKPVFDLYALFSPFNEANKAFYPFIAYLKSTLKKGDIIVDVGNRAGWSAALLSGLFPDQKIISIWEGDTDVLGYGGYAYWFDRENSNVEIYFCNMNEPLPFADKTVAFVYALDVLHRQIRTNLVNELIRVVKDEALVVFPHVHMANAEPEPYFKRGGDLVHGLAYQKLFSTLNHRKSYVFSEPELFRASFDKSYKAKANPNTINYNGLVAITPEAFDLENELSVFKYFDYFTLDDGYLLPNEILETDENNSIRVRSGDIEAQIEKLLSHHPVYIERLKGTIGYTLTEEEQIVLYWAKKCRPCWFIQKQLNTDGKTLKAIIEKLEQLDILQLMPLHPKYVRMQHYFAYQEFTEATENLTLSDLWERSVRTFPDNTYVADRNDNTFYSYREFDEIVKYITSTLIQSNIKKGDKIVLHADINFEAIGLFWACMHLGVVFIPISSSLPGTIIADLIEKYQPKQIFLSHDAPIQQSFSEKVVYFDNENSSTGDKFYFSAWLKEGREIPSLPKINENDLGVILHTSGSTGIPKGVKLTHGQLFVSAKNMVKTYFWTAKDNYLSIGDLDSMSGFRNACIATAEACATCVIPSFGEKNNVTNLLECIYETEITILVTSPGLLNQLLSKKDVKNRISKVRCVLSTGSNLSTQLKTEFFEKTNKRICNYYGLTETTGLCIAEPLNSTNFNGNFIGYPVDCIVNIVDENNNRVSNGETGELLIYSYAISKSYYSDANANQQQMHKWYHTGDLVKMTPDGAIEIIGRKKDFIKNARGEIIYFKEIEDALSQLRFIADFSVVSFLQDECEKTALFVEVNNGLSVQVNVVEEIKKQLTILLGSNKIPSLIKAIEKIPRNQNGKLIKAELNRYL